MGKKVEETDDSILHVGIDVGSTTVKLVAFDVNGKLVFSEYHKHFSDIRETVVQMFEEADEVLTGRTVTAMITGSGGFNIAKKLGIPFVQEVIASTTAVEEYVPATDVALELGGEDAKVTFFGDSIEQRMNGTCAGGTGAFVDQMAALLQTDAAGLNELAKKKTHVYPIASRCGVFAKTDVQPLLNEGASKEDVAVSILQAVVTQTIAGLCCGTPVRGNVAFLGGPLHFLSELRQRFIETLNLKPEEIIDPENSHFFVAMGAAIASKESKKTIPYDRISRRLKKLRFGNQGAIAGVEPLFPTPADYEVFKERHSRHKVERFDLEDFSGDTYLGIDAGSTTTKLALIDEKGKLLHSYYGSNLGSPLNSTIAALLALGTRIDEITEKSGHEIRIRNAAVTGYGEALLQNALKVDVGEIETVAHYKAAEFFLPGVDFVIDIGGQDMKCLKLKEGVIDSIMLNEACSSGCGSFVETFAKAMGMEISDFARAGVESQQPVDLGSRCTVFMNSRVKQAQKEGASLSDISGGISLSIIKNALYKVIRLRNTEQLGKKIVVQGGTFYNDAVLRGFETIVGREVVRPDIAGIMGAFGAALVAQERYHIEIEGKIRAAKKTAKKRKKSKSSKRKAKKEEKEEKDEEKDEKEESDPSRTTAMLWGDALRDFKTDVSLTRCKKCTNTCLLTINHFSDGRQFVSGNRCERGAGLERANMNLPNMFDFKYDHVFDFKSLKDKDAPRGKIGIPRALNMYEDYPFWHTFFTHLGFNVILSRASSKKTFEMGMETIPSESVCYPAKLVHGHVMELVKRRIKTIFYPCIPFNREEDDDANNHYNCPIVQSYPEVILHNMGEVRADDVKYLNPFLPIDRPKKMVSRLFDELRPFFDISKAEIASATAAAYEALESWHSLIHAEGEVALKYLDDHPGQKALVVVGRPYHLDPEIHHGIPRMMQQLGFVVLTEDSVAHLVNLERPLRIVDQWVYHARMYRAAQFVTTRKDCELVQLISFGCGLDAVTSDQVLEILLRSQRIYTGLKIDEISNLGAARIRVRSLMAAITARDRQERLRGERGEEREVVIDPLDERVIFTKEMKETHTLIVPQMSPVHFQFLIPVFEFGGYKAEVLDTPANQWHVLLNEGLNSVHNDACYPSLVVIGQIMAALRSGKYDLSKTAVLLSQTGGACRATNYVPFLRKALKDADMAHVPVVTWSVNKAEDNPGFKFTPRLLVNFVMACLYGDALMRILLRMRPYEKEKGSANALHDRWAETIKSQLHRPVKWKEFQKTMKDMVRDFDNLPIHEDLHKPRVGVVGEIFLKFSPQANHEVVSFIENEGAEAVVPDLVDFFLYSLSDHTYRYTHLSGTFGRYCRSKIINAVLEKFRGGMKSILNESDHFTAPHTIKELQSLVKGVISVGNQAGEGWLLTAEMIELIRSGVNNVVCVQPFGCLPNHIVGKGMIGMLRRLYPLSNIAAIDYDPGASEVNQLNRLKLMMATAFKNLPKQVQEDVDRKAAKAQEVEAKAGAGAAKKKSKVDDKKKEEVKKKNEEDVANASPDSKKKKVKEPSSPAPSKSSSKSSTPHTHRSHHSHHSHSHSHRSDHDHSGKAKRREKKQEDNVEGDSGESEEDEEEVVDVKVKKKEEEEKVKKEEEEKKEVGVEESDEDEDDGSVDSVDVDAVVEMDELPDDEEDSDTELPPTEKEDSIDV